jgi:hypothetical protein
MTAQSFSKFRNMSRPDRRRHFSQMCARRSRATDDEDERDLRVCVSGCWIVCRTTHSEQHHQRSGRRSRTALSSDIVCHQTIAAFLVPLSAFVASRGVPPLVLTDLIVLPAHRATCAMAFSTCAC